MRLIRAISVTTNSRDRFDNCGSIDDVLPTAARKATGKSDTLIGSPSLIAGYKLGNLSHYLAIPGFWPDLAPLLSTRCRHQSFNTSRANTSAHATEALLR